MWSLHRSLKLLDIRLAKGVARRLFMSQHNMTEERSLGVKIPGESKVERPCRGTGGGGAPLSAITLTSWKQRY